jgi:lipid-binding SYLF domain-containing protein
MNLRPFFALPLAATVIAASVPAVMASQQDAIRTVQSATQVFASEMTNPQSQIPKSVLQNALGIAIIPNVVKAGFIVGATRGEGVLNVHRVGAGWSDPAFVSLTAGSVGLQVGGETLDLILIFNTRKSLEKALTQDFNIGGSVTAAAGPTGAAPVTATTVMPDVYTYVRTKNGLFGGVSLAGTKLAVDASRNAEFYGQPGITAQQIFFSPPPAPAAAANLRLILRQYAPSLR